MMNASSPLIVLQSVGKTYGTGEGATTVLKDINLTINEGEFLAIVGPSGSGKSTLMHIIGFLDAPSVGTYTFHGRDTSGLLPDDFAKIRAQDIAFVFQAFHLLPRLTVTENVTLPLLYHPTIKKEEREAKALAAIESVGLTPRKDFAANKLSGGQKQRTAIARALVTSPKVIFADEPTGNLDSLSGKAVLEIFRGLHKQGKTVIIVTHDPGVAAMCDRVISLRDGLIISDERKRT